MSPEWKARFREYMQAMDPHTVHGALGIRFAHIDDDEVVVEVDVSERLFQHGGVVHGGVSILLAESAASALAAVAVDVTQFRVAGQEISASHLRSVSSGKLIATARPIRRGHSTHVCNVDVTDGDGRLVSVVRCSIAIRPLES